MAPIRPILESGRGLSFNELCSRSFMNMKGPAVYRRFLPGVVLAILTVSGLAVSAQNVAHLTVTQPGGMPGGPVITGAEKVTNGVRISWYGPPGYYQIVKSGSPNSKTWQ